MYQIFKNWINFVSSGSGNISGLSLSNQEQFLLFGTMIVSILLIVFFADLIYRIIRSFVRS